MGNISLFSISVGDSRAYLCIYFLSYVKNRLYFLELAINKAQLFKHLLWRRQMVDTIIKHTGLE